MDHPLHPVETASWGHMASDENLSRHYAQKHTPPSLETQEEAEKNLPRAQSVSHQMVREKPSPSEGADPASREIDHQASRFHRLSRPMFSQIASLDTHETRDHLSHHPRAYHESPSHSTNESSSHQYASPQSPSKPSPPQRYYARDSTW